MNVFCARNGGIKVFFQSFQSKPNFSKVNEKYKSFKVSYGFQALGWFLRLARPGLDCPLALPRAPALDFPSWIKQFRCPVGPDKCFSGPERRDKGFFPKFPKLNQSFSKVFKKYQSFPNILWFPSFGAVSAALQAWLGLPPGSAQGPCISIFPAG